MQSVETSSSGASDWLFAYRDSSLIVTSSDWTGETATIESRVPGGSAFTLEDSAGDVAFTANGARYVRGGLEYRMNKASTGTVKMVLLSGLAAPSV